MAQKYPEVYPRQAMPDAYPLTSTEEIPRSKLIAMYKFDNAELTEAAASLTYTRNSKAYLNTDGRMVWENAPRFEPINLLTSNQANGGEAGNTTGFYAVNATISSATDKFYSGARSIKAVLTDSGVAGGSYAKYERVVAGTVYSAQTKVLGSAAKTMRIGLSWKNAANGTISTDYGETTTVDTSEWTTLKVENKTAPAEAVWVALLTYTLNDWVTGEANWRDELQLEVGATCTTFRWGETGGGLGVTIEEGTTNLFSANQAGLTTDTTGFYSDKGAVLTRDTTAAYRIVGTAALKMVTPNVATGEGTTTGGRPATGGQTYTGSVYVCGSGTVKVSIAEKKDASIVATTLTDTITLTSVPTRYSATRTIAADSNAVLVQVITASQQAATIYASGFQIENKAYATSWQDPAQGARAAEVLSLPSADILSPQRGTIEMVVNLTQTMLNVGDPYVFSCSDGTKFILCGYDHTTHVFRMNTSNTAWTGYTSAESPATTVLGRHRLRFSWSPTEINVALDGTKGTPTATPNLPDALTTTFYIGSSTASYGHSAAGYGDVHIANIQRPDTDIASRGVLTPLEVDINTTLWMPLVSGVSGTARTTSKVLTDYSGNARHGTFGSTTNTDTNDPIWSSTGLYFEVDDYIKLWTGAPFPVTEYTVMAVTTQNLGATDAYLLCANAGSGDASYTVRKTGLRSTVGGVYKSLTTKPIPDALAVVTCKLKNNVMSMQINNDAPGTASAPGTVSNTYAVPRYIGWGGSTTYYKGTVHFLAIWHRALTDEEISRVKRYLKTEMAKRGLTLTV